MVDLLQGRKQVGAGLPAGVEESTEYGIIIDNPLLRYLRNCISCFKSQKEALPGSLLRLFPDEGIFVGHSDLSYNFSVS